MIANRNPETGIAYGYISAAALDGEVVAELMDGKGTTEFTNLSYQSWLSATSGGSEDEFYENFDTYMPDEEEVEGITKEGVHYKSSWLGGALNFWIFESPVTTDKARGASPCVPGAGILDTLDGSGTAYDVPADWRRQD